MSFRSISPQACHQAYGEDGFLLIDVRTAGEYSGVHAACARNIPLDRLDPENLQQSGIDPRNTIYVICKSGARGAKASQKLVDAGFADVRNVQGGTDAWCKDGLPVVRGRSTLSLSRQVQIIAGSSTAISGILAMFVHPAFAAIAACMGAGLLHAGLTDSCLMGMMLAKMPWNQAPCASNEVSGANCCSNPTS